MGQRQHAPTAAAAAAIHFPPVCTGCPCLPQKQPHSRSQLLRTALPCARAPPATPLLHTLRPCSLPRHCLRRRRQPLLLGSCCCPAGVGGQPAGGRGGGPAAQPHQPGPHQRAACGHPGGWVGGAAGRAGGSALLGGRGACWGSFERLPGMLLRWPPAAQRGLAGPCCHHTVQSRIASPHHASPSPLCPSCLPLLLVLPPACRLGSF